MVDLAVVGADDQFIIDTQIPGSQSTLDKHYHCVWEFIISFQLTKQKHSHASEEDQVNSPYYTKLKDILEHILNDFNKGTKLSC